MPVVDCEGLGSEGRCARVRRQREMQFGGPFAEACRERRVGLHECQHVIRHGLLGAVEQVLARQTRSGCRGSIERACSIERCRISSVTSQALPSLGTKRCAIPSVAAHPRPS